MVKEDMVKITVLLHKTTNRILRNHVEKKGDISTIIENLILKEYGQKLEEKQ